MKNETLSDLEIEGVVLGSMMLIPACLHEVLITLKSEHFSSEKNQKVFSAIESLSSENNPVDILTVTQRCKKNDTIKFITPQYISKLVDRVAGSSNVEYHCKIILQKFISRKIIETCIFTSQQAQSNEDPILVLDALSSKLTSLNEALIGKDYECNLNQDVTTVVNSIINATQNELTGISTGQPDLDKHTGGFNKSDLIILCARPGMGKTTRVLSFLKHAAKQNKKVAFFSLEMSKEQLIKKMIIEQSNVYSGKVMHHEITDREIPLIHNAGDYIKKLPIYINDKSAISINYLRTVCKERQRKYGLDMIIVDYLQIMRPNEVVRGQSEERIISEISMGLKSIAKDLKVPVIALAQLNRDVEKRSDKRPMKSDLRHSGQLEQDADLILGLYRPSQYYEFSEDKDYNTSLSEDEYTRLSEMLILKNRHGESEIKIKEKFIGELSRFEIWNNISFENNPVNIVNQNIETDVPF